MAGKELYTAKAHVDGGRVDGHGRTDDGKLEVDLRQPGNDDEDEGTNPEQLFAIGYGACFDGALGAVARRQKVETGEVSVDSSVTLITGEDRSFGLKVRLDVELSRVEDAEQRRSLSPPRTACARTRTPCAGTSRSSSPSTASPSTRASPPASSGGRAPR